MATHWVDASGGSPGGYISFTTLVAGVSFSDNDIIEVVDNGEIDDSGGTSMSFDDVNSLTIRSWVDNVNKPTIKLPNTNDFIRLTGNGDNVVQNLNMYKTGPNPTRAFIYKVGYCNSLEVSGCEFLVVDPTGISATCNGVDIGDNEFTTLCNIIKNDFKNVYAAVFTGAGGSG